MNKWLTFSYDDGVTQDRRLVEIFRTYGIKATFNLNSGSLGTKQRITHYGYDVCFDKVDAEEVKTLYSEKDGFEVAVHGKKHLGWNKITDEEMNEEIGEDKSVLEKLSGQNIIGAGYPFGSFDESCDKKLRAFGLQYSRTIYSTHSFDLPENLMFWHPTCHDNDAQIFALAEKFLAYEGDSPCLFYIWGHSFEFDKGDRDRWHNMEKLCKMLSGKNDVWYATNGQICTKINSLKSAGKNA